MTVAFNLTVFGWHISTFNIRIDIDPGSADIAESVAAKPLDRMSDYFARRWMKRRMAS
jgi:hypothetical protein